MHKGAGFTVGLLRLRGQWDDKRRGLSYDEQDRVSLQRSVFILQTWEAVSGLRTSYEPLSCSISAFFPPYVAKPVFGDMNLGYFSFL